MTGGPIYLDYNATTPVDPRVVGHDLLTAVPQLAASTGSACHSGTHRPSPVLAATGHPAARAMAALRLSLGRWTTADEVDRAAGLLTAALATPYG